jgi:membrane protein DedA with SNARE-associated domain
VNVQRRILQPRQGAPLEDLLIGILTNSVFLLYPFITAWTFVEGETVVIFTGVLASEGKFNINVEFLALAAFTGSFLGDQLYYYIGRKYGTPLLERWPTLTHKIEWAFNLVKNAPVVFILSFRWIYGIRNVAPFVIGIAGVSRVKYFALNFIAAMIWAHSFAWGGYFLGRKLEEWLGDSKWFVLGAFVLAMISFAVFSFMRQRRKIPAPAAKIAKVSVTEAAQD